MNENSSIRFERIWTRLVVLFVLAISAYFLITEFDGFVRLFEWLVAGIANAPQSVTALVSYYAALPIEQLLPSLLIGALVGILGTLNMLRPRRGLASPQVWIGAGIGAISAQILTATVQHCTYSPEAPTAQALIGAGVTAVSALVLLLPFWTRRRRVESTTGTFRRPLIAFVLLTPTVLSLLVFLYYPSIQTVLLSLNARRFPLPQERFVCLTNYVTLVEDVAYQSSFYVTVFITIFLVLFSLSLALAIAVLASQKVRGASIYRTFLIWPFALSPVVTGVIFLALFREGGSGLINFALDGLFGIQPSWLRDPNLARWVIVLASVWNVLGFNILFYIAGLQNVPKDLLEAAEIDGANRLQRFIRVTFPLLSPYTFFLLVTNVTYAFYGIYGAVDALTQGGPPLGPAGQFGGATNVLIYKLYEDAFTPGSPVGLAAAQALILFLCVAGLTIVQFRTLESRITYGD